MKKSGKDRAEIFAKARKDAEQDLIDRELLLAKDEKLLAKAQADATQFKDAKNEQSKSVLEDNRKIADEQQKITEDGLKMWQDELDRKRALMYEQRALDREMTESRKQRQDAQLAGYLPTLEHIAGSSSWSNDPGFQMQRRWDERAMAMGFTAESKHAGEAQELIKTKEDLARAIIVDGPNSARAKNDLKKIDSLTKGLEKAGYKTSENRLESIDKHIADLLDKASKDGLIVQPLNGA